MIVDPLHLFNCSLITDGVAVVLLASAERARDRPNRPVYISRMQGLRSGRSEFIFGPPGLGINQQKTERVTPRERDLAVYRRTWSSNRRIDGLLRDKTRPSRIAPLAPEVAERVVALTIELPPGETTH